MLAEPFMRFALLVALLGTLACQTKHSGAPALSPQESLKSFHLSEDFHVELLAAEPQVFDPVEMAFDENGRIYVHFGHQGTACLDLSGKVLWTDDLHAYEPVHGNGGSPILVNDLLIFSCDGGDQAFVAALEASTGKVRWKTDRSVEADRRFSFSTPLLITVNGRKQLISPSSGAVYAYDPETGKEIWRVRYDGYSVISRPIYGHGLVFISTGYNAPSLLAIRPDGRGDITDTHIAWSINHAAPHAPCPLLVGEEIYMVSDNGIASCAIPIGAPMARLARRPIAALDRLSEAPMTTNHQRRAAGCGARSVRATAAACSPPYTANSARIPGAELQRCIAARDAASNASKAKCRP